MKKKKVMESSTIVVAYVSLGITLISVLWNIFFGYGKLVGKIDAMQVNLNEFKVSVDRRFDKVDARFDKIETKLDKLTEDFHELDVRVNLRHLKNKLEVLQVEFHKHDIRITHSRTK